MLVLWQWLGLAAVLVAAQARATLTPVPVVIWHGLGDRYDAGGLLELQRDIESRLPGTYVHIIRLGSDGASDQRATFFGNANEQVTLACEQLQDVPAISSAPYFDAIGFSQGGQLLRAMVERCGGEGKRKGLRVRNLITVGSQHMGISAVPPCPPGSSPFSPCRLMHLSLVREGMYSSWAQHNIVPAQYFREQARIDDYLAVNQFLADINNERVGDEQVDVFKDLAGAQGEPRNSTYKHNFASLNKLILLRFSRDLTVVPPHSAHFTLPDPNAANCPTPPAPIDPSCYLDAIPWSSLPLYKHDYIGLRRLHETGRVERGVCQGRQVTHLYYESYVPLAIKTLHSVLEQVRTLPRPPPLIETDDPTSTTCCPPIQSRTKDSQNVPLIDLVRCEAWHLLGESPPLTPSIVICVSAPHRRDAFVACEWLLEQVKRKVQVWKREWYADGTQFHGQDGTGPDDHSHKPSSAWKENFPVK
ncbi:hypothetical protein OIV83_005915 [Microbotryomycetes sp. JL201]|nr:hypothetical protein OIV83_005915 [Microbotryomycetes sp. JL201]